MTTAAVVDGWWAWQRAACGDRSQRKALEAGQPESAWAALDSVDETVARGGVEALDLVVALLRAAVDEDGVATVGAGPLEDLLHAHGDALVDRLEVLAGTEPRLAHALSAVDLGGGLTAETTTRIVRLRR